MKFKSSKVLKSLIAVILAVLMVVGTTVTGFAAVFDFMKAVGSVWGDSIVKGAFDGWTEHKMTNSGGIEYSVVDIDPKGTTTTYEFVFIDNQGRGVGNKGTIESTVTNWDFWMDDGNCKLKTNKTGKYLFAITDAVWEYNKSHFKCSVYYPLTTSLSADKATVKSGETVNLTKSSSDGYGTISYSYKVVKSGTTTDISSQTISNDVFTAPTVTSNTNYDITVTATDGVSRTATSTKTTITVEPSGSCNPSISPTSKTLNVGGTQTFTVSTGSYCHGTGNCIKVEIESGYQSKISFSDGTFIKNVAENGTVTVKALQNTGGATAKVKVSCTSDTSASPAYADITVNTPSLTFHSADVNLKLGATETHTATINNVDFPDRAVHYSSSEPDIASVDSNGVVTANDVGNATITATLYYNGSEHTTYNKSYNVEVSAEYYLKRGNHSEVNIPFRKDGDIYIAELPLTEGNIYRGAEGFYVYATDWGSKYWKNDGEFQRKDSGNFWDMDENTPNNFGIFADVDGTYTLRWKPLDKQLSVTFPTRQVEVTGVSIPDNGVHKGKSVTATASADFGTSPYTYAFSLDNQSSFTAFGIATYSIDSTNLDIGTHHLYVKAKDASGTESDVFDKEFTVGGYYIKGLTTSPDSDTPTESKRLVYDSTSDTYKLTYTFSDSYTTKDFKIYDSLNDKTYSNDNAGTFTRANSGQAWTFLDSQSGSTHIAVDIAGDYIFEWDTKNDSKKLSITYPTAYKAKAIGKNNEGGSDIGSSNKVVVTPPTDSDKAENYFAPGSNVTFVATNDGTSYKFEGWYDENNQFVSDNLSYTVTNISQNTTLYALYSHRLAVAGPAASGKDEDWSSTEMTFDRATGKYTISLPGYSDGYNEGLLRIVYNNTWDTPIFYNLTSDGDNWKYEGTGIKMWLPAGYNGNPGDAGRCNIHSLDSNYQSPFTLCINWDPTKNDNKGGYVIDSLEATPKASKSVSVAIPLPEGVSSVSGTGDKSVGNPVEITINTSDSCYVTGYTATVDGKPATLTSGGSPAVIQGTDNSNTPKLTFDMPEGDVVITLTATTLYEAKAKIITNGSEETTGGSYYVTCEEGTHKEINGKYYFAAGVNIAYHTCAYVDDIKDTSKAQNDNFAVEGMYAITDTDYQTKIQSTMPMLIGGTNIAIVFYRNIYFDNFKGNFDDDMRMTYSPKTNSYSLSTSNYGNFHLTFDKSHYNTVQDFEFTETDFEDGGHGGYPKEKNREGINIWYNTSKSDEGRGFEPNKFYVGENYLEDGYTIPYTFTMKANYNGGNNISFEPSIKATELIPCEVIVTDDTDHYTYLLDQESYYAGDKAVVTFTMTNQYLYLDSAKTTIVGKSGQTYTADIDELKRIITIQNLPSEESITITPAVKTMYKLEGDYTKRDWSSESGTIADISITNIENGYFVEDGTEKTAEYSFEYRHTFGDYYTFAGWYLDENCEKLYKAADSQAPNDPNANKVTVHPTQDMHLYALFVRNLYVQVYGTTVDPEEWATTKQLKYDVKENRYYYDNIAYTGDSDFRFMFWDLEGAKDYANEAWKAAYLSPSRKEGLDISREYSDSSQPAYVYNINVQDGYSSPITVYFDMKNKEKDSQGGEHNTIYAKASYVGARVYLSSGMNIEDGNTYGQGGNNRFSVSKYVNYDTPETGSTTIDGVTIYAQKSMYSSEINSENIIKLVQTNAENIDVQTTIQDSFESKYRVVSFVYYDTISKKMSAIDESNISVSGNTYSANIPIAKTSVTYVVPIFEQKGLDDSNSKYIVLNKKDLGENSDWGVLAAAHIFGGDGGMVWPGQLMIPDSSGNTFRIRVPKDSNLKVTFNNYLWGTAFVDDEYKDDFDLSIKDNVQTYDYQELSVLANNPSFSAIEFDIKKNNDDYHGIHYNTSDYSRTTKSITENDGTPKQQIILEDYNFDYLYKRDGQTPMNFNLETATGTASYFVVSEGDVDAREQGLGQWAVQWYIYDQSGKFITKVYSKDLYDKESGEDDTILVNKLEEVVGSYGGEAVQISYEAQNKAGDGHRLSYDGQWYATSDTETYPIYMKTAVIDLVTDNITQLTDNSSLNPVGTVTMDYKGYKLPTVPSWNGILSEGNICFGNQTFSASAQATSNYSFYSYYTYHDGIYSKVNNSSEMMDLSATTTTTFVAVFREKMQGTYQYKYKDRFDKDKVYTKVVDLSIEEIQGCGANDWKPGKIKYLVEHIDSLGKKTYNTEPLSPGEKGTDIIKTYEPKNINVFNKAVSWNRSTDTPVDFSFENNTATINSTETPLLYNVKLWKVVDGNAELLETKSNISIGEQIEYTGDDIEGFTYWSTKFDGSVVLSRVKGCKVVADQSFFESDGLENTQYINLYAIVGGTISDTLTWNDPVINKVVTSREKSDLSDVVQTDILGMFTNSQAKSIASYAEEKEIEFGVAYIYSNSDTYKYTEKGENLYPSDSANFTQLTDLIINKYASLASQSESHVAVGKSGKWRIITTGYGNTGKGSMPGKDELTVFNRLDIANQWNYKNATADSTGDVKDRNYTAFVYMKVDYNGDGEIGKDEMKLSAPIDGYFYVGE